MLSPRIRHLLQTGEENLSLADKDGSTIPPVEIIECDLGLVADAVIRLQRSISELEKSVRESGRMVESFCRGQQ